MGFAARFDPRRSMPGPYVRSPFLVTERIPLQESFFIYSFFFGVLSARFFSDNAPGENGITSAVILEQMMMVIYPYHYNRNR